MQKFIKIMKKVKIKNMIILILLLLFNTYAWFIYATRVATDVTAHISSWNVEFVGSEGEITTNLLISIGRIYPGMEKYEKIIEVHNKGETKAELDYSIESFKVMGETFTVTGETTKQDLVDKMTTEYPFKINIEKDDTLLSEGTGNGLFKISLNWDFESEAENGDELDTMWGNKAYEFYSLNPGENCIEIEMTLMATQKEEQGS